MNAAHPNSSQQETKRFPTVPVYSTNAALKFEESETRDNFPTIQVQAAKRIGNGNENGGYKYSWDTNKILIQLTRDELPVFTAVLLGLIHEIRYEYRGRDRNKSFAIFLDNRNSHNEAHYVMELQEKSKRKLVVPIPPADAFYVVNLCLRQLRRSQTWMSTGDLMIVLKAVVGRLHRK